MTALIRRLKIKIEERRITREIFFLIKKIRKSGETSSLGLLNLFLALKTKRFQEIVFRRLEKNYMGLSYYNIHEATRGKIPTKYQERFWAICLKIRIDHWALCQIACSAESFFAEAAFKEIERRILKKLIKGDLKKRVLLEVMAKKVEFCRRGWDSLKEESLAYDDLCILRQSLQEFHNQIKSPNNYFGIVSGVIAEIDVRIIKAQSAEKNCADTCSDCIGLIEKLTKLQE